MLRARAGARYLMIAAACAGVITACGSTAAPSSGAAAPPKVSLDIKVTGGPNTAAPKHWTLRCDPTGGNHPDAAAACRVLLKTKNPFAPVPKGIMCPMIIAGTQLATVKGTYFGQHIDTTFTHGGCQLARWAKIGQIFN